MSAINRMLLELDRRHGLAQEAIPPLVRVVAHQDDASGLPVRTLAIAFLTLAAAWFGLQSLSLAPHVRPSASAPRGLPILPETAAIAPRDEAAHAPPPVTPELVLDYKLSVSGQRGMGRAAQPDEVPDGHVTRRPMASASAQPAYRESMPAGTRALGTTLQVSANLAAPTPTSEPTSEPRAVRDVTLSGTLESHLAQARQARRDQRHHDAMRAWQAVLAAQPEQNEALRGMAQSWMDLDQPERAQPWLARLHAASPQDAWAALLLARMQASRDELGPAALTLKETLDAGGANAELHALAAGIAARRGAHADAVSHYRRALARQPFNGIWLMGLGLSQEALGQLGEAEHSLRYALESGALGEKLEKYLADKLNRLQQTGG